MTGGSWLFTHRSIRTSLICALLLTASAPALAGHVFDPKGTDVIAAGGGQGGGWLALEFTTDGATAYVDLVADRIDSPGHAGIYAFTEAGWMGGGTQVINLDGFEHVSVASTLHEDANAEVETIELNGDWGAAVRYRINDPGDTAEPSPGTFRYVLLATGSTTWEWELRGNPGIEVVRAIQGDTSQAYSSVDFEAPLNAEAWVDAKGGQATVLGELAIEPEHTLVGTFWTASPSNRLAMETDERSRDCSCTFGSIGQANGFGDGAEHRFSLTGASAGGGGTAGVLLGVADIPVPWGG